MVESGTTKGGDFFSSKQNYNGDVSESLNVFIDNGHCTIKCMKIDNFEVSADVPHLEIPTMLL